MTGKEQSKLKKGPKRDAEARIKHYFETCQEIDSLAQNPSVTSELARDSFGRFTSEETKLAIEILRGDSDEK